ncbi:MAG: hypothetical protein ACRCXZ_08050 [Patescibacteria group bacterium]
MENIKENLNYIISEEDNDKIKFNKLYKKMSDNSIKLSVERIDVVSVSDAQVFGNISLNLQGDVKTYPFILKPSELNSEIHNVIINLKKIIIFEELGIVPTFSVISDKNATGGITDKQKVLLQDKLESNLKDMINGKLTEFGVSTIDELNKQQASSIIDTFHKNPRR